MKHRVGVIFFEKGIQKGCFQQFITFCFYTKQFKSILLQSFTLKLKELNVAGMQRSGNVLTGSTVKLATSDDTLIIQFSDVQLYFWCLAHWRLFSTVSRLAGKSK